MKAGYSQWVFTFPLWSALPLASCYQDDLWPGDFIAVGGVIRIKGGCWRLTELDACVSRIKELNSDITWIKRLYWSNKAPKMTLTWLVFYWLYGRMPEHTQHTQTNKAESVQLHFKFCVYLKVLTSFTLNNVGLPKLLSRPPFLLPLPAASLLSSPSSPNFSQFLSLSPL